MAMYTKVEKIMEQLSYAQKDETMNLVYNQAFPGLEMPLESGTFKELNERAYFIERDADVTKYSIPKAFQIGDSKRTYNITPIGSAFEYSNIDLYQAELYGKGKAAKMIQEQQEINAIGLKKLKEKAFYTAVTTDANFEGATYYANAGTAWSTTGTANTKDDIDAGKLIVPGLNAGIISKTASIYAMANATMNASTVVSAPRRDGNVDPNPTVEFLKNYWGLQYLWIAEGSLITDSGDPTDTTKTEIWGDSMLLWRHSPRAAASELQASWCKHLFFRPMGKGETQEGWFVNATETDEEGGVGIKKFATWNYFQFMIHEKSYAYRIDNLY